MTRLALLATAVTLTLGATPVLAQTFNGYDNNDPAVTQGYAPYEHAPTSNGWNNGPPVIGPLFGAVTAPFAVATGAWGQPANGCFVDRDFNGRYTALCGL
jgi:hypothetical protein